MKNILFIVASIGLVSCGGPVLKTIYTAPAPVSGYKKILVIVIMPEGEQSHEREMENSVIRSLGNKGLEAVSYTDAISIYDTCQPCLDAFYFSLEEKNIDGILTITKLASSTGATPVDWKTLSAVPFYLDYVWKYKDRQRSGKEQVIQKYYWESILFDLHGLETNKVLQSNYPRATFKKKKIEMIVQAITEQMTKQISTTPAPKEKIKQAF